MTQTPESFFIFLSTHHHHSHSHHNNPHSPSNFYAGSIKCNLEGNLICESTHDAAAQYWKRDSSIYMLYIKYFYILKNIFFSNELLLFYFQKSPPLPFPHSNTIHLSKMAAKIEETDISVCLPAKQTNTQNTAIPPNILPGIGNCFHWFCSCRFLCKTKLACYMS